MSEIEATPDEIDLIVYAAGPDADHGALVETVEQIIAERVEAAKAEAALRVVESLHSEVRFQDFDIDRLRAALDPEAP